MPKINVYLPDDLFEQVKRAKLPVSAICQDALSAALRTIAETLESANPPQPPLPEEPDLGIRLGQHVRAIVAIAYPIAAERGSPTVEAEDIFAGIIEQGESLLLLLLEQFGFPPHRLREALEAASRAGRPPIDPAEVRLSDEARGILARAAAEAKDAGAEMLTGRYLFLSLVKEREGVVAEVVEALGLAHTLTNAVFDTSDAGVAYGTHGIAMRKRDVILETMWSDIRTRLDRIEEKLGTDRNGHSKH